MFNDYKTPSSIENTSLTLVESGEMSPVEAAYYKTQLVESEQTKKEEEDKVVK